MLDIKLRPTEMKHSTVDWCGGNLEMLAKSFISWRNWASHILLLCLRCAHPSHPCHPPEASLGKMVTVPVLCAFTLHIPEGELMRRHYTVLSTAAVRCSWVLEYLLPSQRALIFLRAVIAEVFGFQKKTNTFPMNKAWGNKFIHMPWAFLHEPSASVSQLVMLLRNKTSDHHLQGHCIRFIFAILFFKDLLSWFPTTFHIP